MPIAFAKHARASRVCHACAAALSMLAACSTVHDRPWIENTPAPAANPPSSDAGAHPSAGNDAPSVPVGTAGAAAGNDDHGAGAGAAGAAGAAGTSAGNAGSGTVEPADAGMVTTITELSLPEPSGTPVLERTPSAQYACRVTSPFNALQLGETPQSSTALVARGDAVQVSWHEAANATPNAPGLPLKTAQVGMDGVLQSEHVLFTPEPDGSISSIGGMAFGHDRVTLWWDYSEHDDIVALPTQPPPGPIVLNPIDPTSGVVQLDADNAAIAPRRTFDASEYPFSARLIASRTGFLTAWGEGSDRRCTIKLARLDENARLAAPHLTLATFAKPASAETWWCDVAGLAETADGFALVYSRPDVQQQYVYRAFSADGEALGPATRLTPDNTFAFGGATIVVREQDVLVAWTVMVGPNQSVDQVDAGVRIARFDLAGNAIGDVAALASAHTGRFDYPPVWVDLDGGKGGELGLSWTREQKLDASCSEACKHSATVGYAVVDGDDLSLRGAPLELVGDRNDDSVGLGGSVIARSGADLLFMVQRWTQSMFDATGWGRTPGVLGSIAVHCDHTAP